MKLHEDFKKKHNLNDDWMVEIMDSQYLSLDKEMLAGEFEEGSPLDEALEKCAIRFQLQGGYIATVHNSKTKEGRAYFVENGENLLVSEVEV